MSSADTPGPSDKFLQAFDFAAELAEKEEKFTKEVMDTLLRFLDVKDSMEDLLDEVSNNDHLPARVKSNILKRIRLLNRQMELAFERSDVEAIKCVGKEADPQLHQIVAVEARPDLKDNIILKEKVKGYRYRNRLVRRPQVVVAKRKKS